MPGKPPFITLVTTCKGRWRYLEKSLPSWLSLVYPAYEIIVVDYDCPDGAAALIDKQWDVLLKKSVCRGIRVVKISNRPHFNLNEARNIGILASKSDWLLLIDSDIRIRDRYLLGKIAAGIEQDIVFFSNLSILHSGIREGGEFYRRLYQVQVKVPAILPVMSGETGLSGTACFRKDLYESCGRFNPVINDFGYGCDDIEFYLRYLNTLARRMEREGHGRAKKKNYLDRTLRRLATFSRGAFHNTPNTDEERGRFYAETHDQSVRRNHDFINRFFAKSLQRRFSRRRVAKLKPVPLEKWLKKNCPQPPAKLPLTEGFFSWFWFWLGRELFQEGRRSLSKKYFLKAVNLEETREFYLAQAHFYLGELSAGKTRIERFQTALFIARLRKCRQTADWYFIGSLHQRLGERLKARKCFAHVITRGDDRNFSAAAHFHLGELDWERGRTRSGADNFQETLRHNPDHAQARKYLQMISGEEGNHAGKTR